MPGTADEHRGHAAGRRARCAVLSVSDTRTVETDRGGRLLREGLVAAGHEVVGYAIVPDDAEAIRGQIARWLGAASPPHVVITTGGTGIARRDTTIEVIGSLLDKRLDGFGELFRMLSWEQVGAAAMLSRAVAGLAGETFLFALPGSPKAVELALDKLLLPELSHLVWERQR